MILSRCKAGLSIFSLFGSILCLLLSVVLFSVSAHAVVELYKFDDEVTQKRYQSFTEELRCPKCQNQNLAGSDSAIAGDLRRELYRLLMEGQSDKEITDFMVNRYGDFVLYRPPLKENTLLLWGLPLVLLLIGILIVAFMLVRKKNTVAVGELGSMGEKSYAGSISGNETDNDSQALKQNKAFKELMSEADARQRITYDSDKTS